MSFDRLIKFFSSLRLTVFLLGLGMILIFAGTLGEVHLGIYAAQKEFFRSFVVFWKPAHFPWRIPIMPGGYLLGGLLLLNLISAHFTRFKWGRKKAGIWLVHMGVILLLMGQLLTDMLAQESQMHLRNGESKNYSESDLSFELAVMDDTDKKAVKVVAIPEHRLLERNQIASAELPFTVNVKTFYANSSLTNNPSAGYEPVHTTAGLGVSGLWLAPLPHETTMDRRDLPTGIFEFGTPSGTIGSWLISGLMDQPADFTYQGHHYEAVLRLERFYKPYSLRLEKFTHDVYKGTDVPKNFSSRLVLDRPDTGEHREVLIYMNNPLRYAGETFYQASFDPDDQGTVLQDVRNPGWVTPYLACLMVGGGLVVQFLSHLIPFLKRRNAV